MAVAGHQKSAVNSRKEAEEEELHPALNKFSAELSFFLTKIKLLLSRCYGT